MRRARGHATRHTVRVLAITTSFPRGPGDPSGSFVEALGSALRPHGIDTTVVRMPAIDGGPLLALERGGACDRLRAALGLARLAIDSRRTADLVLAHWLVPSAWVRARTAGLPIVGAAHGGDARLLARLPVWVRDATLRRLDGLIAVSPAIAMALPHPRTLVTPMGAVVSTVPREPRAGGPLRVLFVGRLVPIKGLRVLLAAAEGLDGITVTVLGDGPERGPLERDFRARFLGGQTLAGVREALARADVLCVPSVGAEGAPLVVQEAAVAGVPVLASDVGGLASVVHPTCLLPAGDVGAWRAALIRTRDEALPVSAGATIQDVGERVAGFLRAMIARDRRSNPEDWPDPRAAGSRPRRRSAPRGVGPIPG